MLEKWGLIVYWDNSNDCYIASVPELLACTGTGQTRQEALEALEQEVEHWLKTSRELGYSHTASETQPQALPTREPQPARPKAAEPPSKIEVNASRNESKIGLSKPLTSGRLTITTARNQPIISLAGEADLHNCSLLRQACKDILDAGGRVVVLDMTELEYLDAAVLGVMVDAVRKFRDRNGLILLVKSKTEFVNRTFAITRLERVFRVCATVNDAVRELSTLSAMPI